MHFFKKLFGKCGKHYVCKGTCGGTSDKAMNCGAPNCPDFNKPMQGCCCAEKSCHTEKNEEAMKN